MSQAEKPFPAMSIAQANAMLTAPGARFELAEAVIGGQVQKIYRNAPATLRDMLETSRGFGAREFLVYGDERVTYAAHHAAAARLAHALRTQFGVEKGDRVAIAARNYPQWSVAFFAAQSLGAVATPLNAWWTGEELHYGLSDSGAKVAIVDVERLERIREHVDAIASLRSIIVMRGGEDEADPRISSLETLIGDANSWASLPAADLPATELAADDDATLFYTSGTTGKPKGAVATHRGVISSLWNGLSLRARSFLRKGEAPPQLDLTGPQSIMLVAIPFFHVTACFANLVATLNSANKIVTVYRWDPLEALKIIERERVTAVGGVPAIAWQLLEHPEREKFDLSSIDTVGYGGAPAAPELVATIKRVFPAGIPSNGWGMTETCATATLNYGRDYEVKPASAGAAAPAVELRIVAADGSDQPPGQPGELWHRGPNNARAYWNRPEDTAKTFRDGWVVTGDIAMLDEEGFLYLLDRAKDMLIRGGENIYCSEVENILYSHPAIMDAAVVGIQHRVLGEEVGAVVQVKPDMTVTVEELRHFAAQHLAAFKVPVEIRIQAEPLPRNANGKILKSELRPLFAPRG